MDFGLTWRDAAIAFADVLPPIELIRATTNDCPSPEISGRIQVNPHLSGRALTSDPYPALRTTKRIEAPRNHSGWHIGGQPKQFRCKAGGVKRNPPRVS